MAQLVVFTPKSADYPASNFPQYQLVNRRPVLSYDATTNETAEWTHKMPAFTGALTAVVSYIMATATSGDVDIDVSIEAVTDADTTDLDAGDSFDTVNSTDNTTVPGTAGYMDEVSVTLTNADSIAAGDYFRLRVTRDAASDTAAGDLHLLAVELRDAS